MNIEFPKKKKIAITLRLIYRLSSCWLSFDFFPFDFPYSRRDNNYTLFRINGKDVVANLSDVSSARMKMAKHELEGMI